jgi:hypothetical protein
MFILTAIALKPAIRTILAAMPTDEEFATFDEAV